MLMENRQASCELGNVFKETKTDKSLESKFTQRSRETIRQLGLARIKLLADPFP